VPQGAAGTVESSARAELSPEENRRLLPRLKR
jgi:hypothetical protein